MFIFESENIKVSDDIFNDEDLGQQSGFNKKLSLAHLDDSNKKSEWNTIKDIAKQIFYVYFNEDQFNQSTVITKGERGDEILGLRSLLWMLGYTDVENSKTLSEFDITIEDSIKKYQQSNVDINGDPLEVTGKLDVKTLDSIYTEFTKSTPYSEYGNDEEDNDSDTPSSSSISYSVSRDGSKKLSDNFKVSDFRCKDNSDTVLINPALVDLLEKIRSHYNKPITIESGYRTKAYNAKVDGKKGSQHLVGNAADIKIPGVSPKELYNWINSWHKGGLGLYKTFVHVDVRDKDGGKLMARWQDTGISNKA